MPVYEGVVDDNEEGETLRVYVHRLKGSYVDVNRREVAALTPLEERDGVIHHRVDVRDDANTSVETMSADEWRFLFDDGERDHSSLTEAQRFIGSWSGSDCPATTSTAGSIRQPSHSPIAPTPSRRSAANSFHAVAASASHTAWCSPPSSNA